MKSENSENQDLKKALLSASQSKTLRSKTAQLREIFEEVEIAKKSGVPIKTIVSILSAQGLEFDFRTFVNSYHRIKVERQKLGSNENLEALNPLRVLTGNLQKNESNATPTAKFET
jgi:hypothetical protein